MWTTTVAKCVCAALWMNAYTLYRVLDPEESFYWCATLVVHRFFFYSLLAGVGLVLHWRLRHRERREKGWPGGMAISGEASAPRDNGRWARSDWAMAALALAIFVAVYGVAWVRARPLSGTAADWDGLPAAVYLPDEARTLPAVGPIHWSCADIIKRQYVVYGETTIAGLEAWPILDRSPYKKEDGLALPDDTRKGIAFSPWRPLSWYRLSGRTVEIWSPWRRGSFPRLYLAKHHFYLITGWPPAARGGGETPTGGAFSRLDQPRADALGGDAGEGVAGVDD